MPNRQPDVLPSLPTDESQRAEHLVVVRESSLNGRFLMEGMIGQTVGSNLHLPGAQEVLNAGMAPLDGTSGFDTYQYRKHRTNAVVFEHEGVIYLYSLGSAAATNMSETDNACIELLCDVFAAYQPVHVYVATFNRLLRSLEFSGKLLQSAKHNVDVFHIGQTTLDPRSPAGKAMWSTFALVADMERDSIVQRLFTGQVNKYIGDGILAVFSDEDDGAQPGDHPIRAVQCATRMVLFPGEFQTGAGLHTGLVVVGNVGSADKMEYTVLGDTVNLASRLESLNKEHKTKLLMSDATQQALNGAIETTHLGTVAVRGKAVPIQLYTVTALLESPKEVSHA